MVTKILDEEWDRRFVNQIIKRLVEGDDATDWDNASATEAAVAELEAVEDEWRSMEPEEAADEALSYWDDGV
jgi:macrodomain Ter protein organizer (MatP/YcbG family)